MPAESASRGDLREQHASSMEGTSSGDDEAEYSSNDTVAAAAADSAPYIGQRFPTHDAAYEFYGGHAKRRGFSIRRHRTEGKDGVGKGLTRRYFVCHRAGNAPLKPFGDGATPQRNRRSSRCGCRALLRIGRDAGAGGPEWRVTGFSDHHNHELLRQDQARSLPVISDTDRERILLLAKSGISVQQMMRIMELEKCVEPGSLPFAEKDVRNLTHSFKRLDQEEEKVDLLEMCRIFKEKDPNFKYDFTRDAHNRLENITWSYASSIQSYEAFGDAVVFDTSHRLTALDMSLGIWIGMNNHGMPCFFGGTLLREENLQSFTWALQVFLNFMNRKAPQTILTDQNICLKEAVEKELPNTKHAFSIWRIAARFPSCFNPVLGEHYNDWENEFYRLYNMESTIEFDLGWSGMVDCYRLHGNRDISSLFASRSSWASPYLRGHFSAGLTASPGVSKSINDFIQRLLSAQRYLSRFIEQVALVVDYKDQAGEQQTMQQNLQNISFKTATLMEGHAAAILTPYAFSKLQDELVAAAHYASFNLEGDVFLVRHHTKTEGGCIVTWNQREEQISCSCQMFESSGILCRHTLRVLTTLNYFQIPDHYLPVRWHKNLPPRSKSLNGAPNHCGASERVKALQCIVSALVSEAAKSDERMDLATHEVSVLLSRIRQQPVSVNVSGDSAHSSLAAVAKHCISSENVNISK
ncbi:protein FAR1-RELATED SEQUENCE 11-like [Lolium rigidum]|uniref:protein FAR1-RELATED SEQUENCE 11-like n=1 Tax=Lolium rigidum TaxID=89674 RepID=UPI001F5C5DBA|nr:protein FAR1-RELATED SEQUENCE 11-like [Lolium rigidum]